jgi:hypothetical protein
MVLLVGGMLRAADIILNEYNAVDPTSFLGGGDSSMDDRGGRASDIYFGRVPGNGGDWFEMAVIKDHLDMRSWQLDTYVNAKLDKTLTITADPLWSDLRAGTIITVSGSVPDRASYNPAAGDWWINAQADSTASGKYISAKSFSVTNKNFQLRIRNAAGAVVFGPAGEGVAPNAKVGNDEVFLLKNDPSAAITAVSTDYDSNKNFSTFGAPNRWGKQDFNDLRPVITPAAATIKVVSPNGLESLTAGKVTTITWQSTGVPETVLVEFSLDGGYSWTGVYPPNVGNTGQYKWLVPLVNSTQALVRVVSSIRLNVYDTSDKLFTILASTSVADLTTAGRVDYSVLADFAASWLN